jgi:hypothetical protein
MRCWAVGAGERHKGCLLPAFARSSNGSHRWLDAMNDNNVALMIVAAITRIQKIPIANAILQGRPLCGESRRPLLQSDPIFL